MTFGHSDVVLRGTGQALAEIDQVFSGAGDGVRPGPPASGAPPGPG